MIDKCWDSTISQIKAQSFGCSSLSPPYLERREDVTFLPSLSRLLPHSPPGSLRRISFGDDEGGQMPVCGLGVPTEHSLPDSGCKFIYSGYGTSVEALCVLHDSLWGMPSTSHKHDLEGTTVVSDK